MARLLRIALALAAVFAVALCVVWPGSGVHEGPGEIAAPRVPDAVIAARARRQAEARRGPGAAPVASEKQILFADLVAFLGWEWTQVGRSPADHYGHKNVVLRDTDPSAVPARPIAAAGGVLGAVMRQRFPFRLRAGIPLLDWSERERYYDFWRFLDELSDTPECPEGVDVRELPAECLENADTPDVLFEKLAQWGFPALVIPHGNAWGFYTPPGSTWDKQLVGAMHDPSRQTLVEVYSGHGNSEQYRSFRAVDHDEKGEAVCPGPQPGYEPCCWRAGELIRARCDDPGSAECEERVA